MVHRWIVVGVTNNCPFKPQPREHWLDKYEREVDEHEETLRKSVMQPSGGQAETNGDHND
jgi:hypothetical protein